MKITVEWLREYLKTSVAAAEIARLLTAAGLRVEAVAGSGDDAVWTFEITGNRADCLSLIGIAREAAVVTGGMLRIPNIPEVSPTGGPEEQALPIAVDDPALCPRYIGRLIRDVAVKPAPGWLKNRLEAVGVRSVNNVVDVTNYVMLESGQPLHAFDYDRLRENRIVVRKAAAGETMTALDGKTYTLSPEMLVIADARVPVAIAGVMGGSETEVTAGTRNVLLESAQFHPVSIRRTRRKLGLASESSHRFERGVDPETVEWASRRAAALLAEVAGGHPEPVWADRAVARPEPALVPLRMERLAGLLGRSIEHATAQRILKGLGFEMASADAQKVWYRVPSHRRDIALEEDLVEEVARVYGYDRIPTSVQLPLAVAAPNPEDERREMLRETLLRLALQEVLTSSFLPADRASEFSLWFDPKPLGALAPDGTVDKYLRPSLVSGLLSARRVHEGAGAAEARLFEIAQVYGRAPAGPAAEKTCLGLLAGTFGEVKGLLAAIWREFGLGDVETAPAARPGFAPARCAEIRIAGRAAGVIGEIAADGRDRYDLRAGAAVAEIDLAVLGPALRPDPRCTVFSRQPAVHRDLAFVLPDAVRWAAVEACARKAAPAFLESVAFLSEYRGAQIPKGSKSLAFAMTFRAPDRTLVAAEADAAVAAIRSAIEAELKGVIRA